MTLSEIFARFICGREEFSEKAVYLAKKSILDSFGAMIIGGRTDLCRRAAGLISPGGQATVVGVGKGYAARDAAFVNGISGHELELDDTSSSNLGHPTIAVLPSLLAVGETTGCSGERLIRAFLLATEVECKIGRICARKLHERGWHASSVTGVIGAAAGSGYLLGQDFDALCNTMGIAASMASGVRENFGTATKSLHIGKTAADGVYAAELSQAGFDASRTALDGKEGYLYEYSTERCGPFDQDFQSSLGNDWDICSPGFAIKRYPSCSSSHRAVDALTDIIDKEGILGSQVEKITVKLSRSAMRELVTPYPKNGEEAKFSIGFQIALYLSGMDNMPEHYSEEVIEREEIQNIVQRTEMQMEEKYNHLPVDMGVGPAFVTVRLKDGREFSKEQIYPVGHLSNPMSDGELKEKFMRCSLDILGQEKASRLYQKLCRLEEVKDISEIMNETC